MILVEVPDSKGLLDLPEGELSSLRTLAGSVDPAVMRIQFAMLARGEERIRRSSQPRFHLELALVHMANAGDIVPVGQAERNVKSGTAEVRRKIAEKDNIPGPEMSTAGKENSFNDGTSGDHTAGSAGPAFAGIDTPEETWDQLLNFVSNKAPNIGSLLEQLVPVKVTDEEVVIGGGKGEIWLEVLQEKEKAVELQNLMKEFLNREVVLKFREMDQVEREKNHNAVEKKQKKESDLARKIRKETKDHPAVKNALDLFQGEIESVRILGQSVSDTSPVENKEEENQ
jgi:DNA polymerase III gamma/tau subunit